MASTLIENYITKRYERWLDYSNYHCELAGMPDEASDVLNEVLCDLLQKDNAKLEKLLQAKKNGYTELDFFVLRMIKLNATSDTSPYRNKYKPCMPVDNDTDCSRLEIEDKSTNVVDNSAILFLKMQIVRFVFDHLEMPNLNRAVFKYRFFEDRPFSEWNYKEWPQISGCKMLYQTYNETCFLIRYVLSNLDLGILFKPKSKQYKGITKAIKKHSIKASRQFMEHIDKRLLKHIKNIEFIENLDFDNNLLKVEVLDVINDREYSIMEISPIE